MAYKILLELIDMVIVNQVKTHIKKIQYECRNIQNFSYDISMPTNAMGIPEQFFDEAIIVKAEGNTGKLNFNWTIKEEDSSPFTLMSDWSSMWTTPPALPHLEDNTTTDYFSRKIKKVGSNDYQNYDLKTADGQMIALSEIFEKKGISSQEKHRFSLFNATDNYLIFEQEGMITRMSFQKAGTDPVTWNATLEFTLGNVLDAALEGTIGSD